MTQADKVMDHVAYPKSLRRKCLESLKFIIEDCRESIKVNPTNPNNGFYQDEINYVLAEIKRREVKEKKKAEFRVFRNNYGNPDGWSIGLYYESNLHSVRFQINKPDSLGLATEVCRLMNWAYKLGLPED